MSHRPEQVASVIRRAVQEQIVRGLHDPRVRGLVSITKVVVDDDLSEATLSISVLPHEFAPLSIEGLRSAAQHIQRRAREGLPLRRMPRLRFVLDDSLKRSAETDAALLRAAGGEHGEGAGEATEEDVAQDLTRPPPP
jgi:ribosome-binding factor A